MPHLNNFYKYSFYEKLLKQDPSQFFFFMKNIKNRKILR